MPTTFDIVAFNEKYIFGQLLSIPFDSYIICLVSRRSAFPFCFSIVLGIDVIPCQMVFKFAYFVEL